MTERSCECLYAKTFWPEPNSKTHPPPESESMAFIGKTKELAEKARVPDAAKEWLAGNGVLDYTDIAMTAASEVEVTPNIIDVLLADGIEPIKAVGGKIAIKELWMACRGFYEADRRPGKDNRL